MPIDKTVRLVAASESEPFHLLNNDNVCLAGTSASAGNGRAVVILTGEHTYMAGIAEELNRKRPENAVQMGIRKVSYVLLGFMIVSGPDPFFSRCRRQIILQVMAPMVFIVQGAVSHDWKGAIMFAIAIAVGITPEMLPMIVVRLSPCVT